MRLPFIIAEIAQGYEGSEKLVELYTEETNHYEIFQENINYSREQMFVDEIKYFIDCIINNEETMNDISNAIRILKVALACHESARVKKVVSVDEGT